MTNNTDLQNTLREIKQSFRLLMNGVTAQSMREKGLDYHLNWGANLLHLREMAAEYTPDRRLAQALWQENIRECKILATLLMPKDEMTYDLAMLWIEQTRTQEMAEIASLNLYQHLTFATEMALHLISSPEEMKQLHGFLLLARMFSREQAMPERDINEFLDQATSALMDDNLAVKHAALNAIQHFADLDETHRVIAKGALKTIKMEDWLS